MCRQTPGLGFQRSLAARQCRESCGPYTSGNHGVFRSRSLLPSEYFRRQCFATFWFERQTLRLLDTYPENFMFETDYPHQNAMAPGPVSPAERPADYTAHAFQSVDPSISRKVLQDNATNTWPPLAPWWPRSS